MGVAQTFAGLARVAAPLLSTAHSSDWATAGRSTSPVGYVTLVG